MSTSVSRNPSPSNKMSSSISINSFDSANVGEENNIRANNSKGLQTQVNVGSGTGSNSKIYR
jgi:hypothetical protein